MPERSGDDQALQFCCRRSQAQEPLAELHKLYIIVLQVRDDLAGEGPVVADLHDVKLAGKGGRSVHAVDGSRARWL